MPPPRRLKPIGVKARRWSFSVLGRPDFDTPAHIKEAAKAALDKGYVHYTPNMGILPLREAVAEHIKRQDRRQL